MIGYVTLGTNNFDAAASFYDELLATIGAGRAMEGDTFIAWSTGPGAPALSIIEQGLEIFMPVIFAISMAIS
jgi:hypothetical protein